MYLILFYVQRVNNICFIFFLWLLDQYSVHGLSFNGAPRYTQTN